MSFALVKCRSKVLFALVLGVVAPGIALGQCIDYGDYLHVAGMVDIPGNAQDAAMAGPLTYLTLGTNGLAILDLADPVEPSVLGTLATGGNYLGLAMAGDRAYVAGDGDGILVLDIGDPSAPQLLATAATTCAARDVALAGSLLVVAENGPGCSRLEVFDLTIPDSPSLLGGVDVGGEIASLSVDGDFAYVGDLDGALYVVYVGTPASPVVLAQDDFPGRCHSVAAHGDLLYVVWGLYEASYVNYYLLGYDVSDPGNPQRLDGPYGRFLGESPATVILLESLAIVQGSALQVFDVADPAAPQQLSALELRGEGVLAAEGQLAVVPGAGRAAVVDLTQLEAPSLLGGMNMGCYPHGIAYRAPYAFVAAGRLLGSDRQGLVVVDVSDSANPQIVREGDPWSLQDLVLDGDLIYGLRFAFVGSEWVYSIQVIDVSDPLAPVALGNCPLPNRCWGIDYADGYVYAACVEAGLRIVSVADPSNPVIVGALPSVDYATDVTVQSGIADLIHGYDGLFIVDVSDPTAPTVLSNVDPATYYYRVERQGSRVVLDADYDLLIVDAADPYAPAILGTALTRGSAFDFAVRGDLVFVGGTGLEIVDIGDPAHPRYVGSVGIPEIFQSLALGEDCVYISEQNNGYGGFQIAPLPCTVTAVDEATPAATPRVAAYPNPFNPKTTFRFTLPSAGAVRLDVFDVAGRRVATPLAGRNYSAGAHELAWQARDDAGRPLATGVYLYRLQAGESRSEGKLTLLK